MKKFTDATITEIVYRFMSTYRKFKGNTIPRDLVGKVVGFELVDGAYQLVATDRVGIIALDKRFITWIEIPEDIATGSDEEFELKLAILIAARLGSSKANINGRSKRDSKVQSAAGKKGAQKRWGIAEA